MYIIYFIDGKTAQFSFATDDLCINWCRNVFNFDRVIKIKNWFTDKIIYEK